MMNQQDVIDILTTAAAVDRRTVGKADVIAWHEIISELPRDLALRAVIDHFREKPGVWLEPGHVHARVRAIQRDRHERLNREELEARQNAIDERLAPRILELAESKSIPEDEIKYHRPSINALRVACPHCKAAAGRPCVRPARLGSVGCSAPLTTGSRYHGSRVAAAEKTAA